MARLVTRGLYLAIVAILASCGSAAADPAARAVATPTPKPFDFSAWMVSVVGTGPAANGAGSALELVMPATAKGDPTKSLLLEVTLQARCQLTGDFDVQADFSLISWPAQDGVHFGLVAGGDSAERSTNPHGTDNLYESYLSGHVTGVQTNDTTGRLRLTRAGTTITSSYLHDQSWVQIASTTGPSTALTYKIGAWTDGSSFGGHEVKVNLNNFSATGCN
jgi:hypothetical protein